MRILNLKFKNINSLAGENEIDFTRSEFTNDGLFAITGKTGSGKSSILDAISLSLYGKTPRVEISANENAVMTRGEKDCYAEITFEVSSKIWKSTWQQNRTKSGKLNPVHRKIAEADGTIIADQVRACDTAIIEIIGLNFNQFTKVIMLAQGSFAAFLQADKNDKGELLEQITGTEIYGEISKKVFERNRIEKEKLDKILIAADAIKVLSEEEIKSLLDENVELEKQKQSIVNKLQNIETAKKWLDDLGSLEKQINTAKKNLPELLQNTQLSKSQLDNAISTQINAKNLLANEEPIFKLTRELDTKIALKEKLLKPLFDTIEALKSESNDLNQELKFNKEKVDQTQKTLIEKQNWKAKHLVYETLVTQYAAIEKEHQILQLNNQTLTTLNEEIEGLNQNLNAKQSEAKIANDILNEKKEKLNLKTNSLDEKKLALQTALAGKERNVLQTDKDYIVNIGTLLKALLENETERKIKKTESEENEQKSLLLEAESDTLSTNIETNKKELNSLNSQIKLLEENILLNRSILSLTEHRQNLKAGESCPLCGSLEHPFAAGNMPQIGNQEQELLNLKTTHEQVSKVLSMFEIKLAEIGSNRNNLILYLTNAEKQIQDLTQKQTLILTDLTELNPTFSYPTSGNKIDLLQHLLTEKQTEFKTINNLINDVTSKENEIIELRDHQIPILERERQLAEQINTNLKIQVGLIEQEFANKKALYDTQHVKYIQDNNDFLKTLNLYEVETILELKNRLAQWNAIQKTIEDLTQQIQGIKNVILVLQNNLDKVALQLQEKELERKEIEIEKSNLSKERVAIFEERQVDEEEYKLKKQIESAELAKQLVEKTFHEISTNLAKCEAIIAEKEKELIEKKSLKISDIEFTDLENEYAKNKEIADSFLQKIGANQQMLKTNYEAQKESGIKLKEKERQQEVYNQWSILDKLIGAGDGKKFRNFAQALTFEHLIGLANKQLEKMSERYLLKRCGEQSNPFELSVIDKFQNGEERTAQNLSGGEKFIVSLSLALGLANMASKNMRIDTMFIDEGFGTLDADYLDVALSALSNLQNEGKIIGVISHLAELKERIATHIAIVPVGNGHSKIEVTN